MASVTAALKGRTHGCTDHAALVKKVLANSEPSTHGPLRHFAALRNLVAIGTIADFGQPNAL